MSRRTLSTLALVASAATSPRGVTSFVPLLSSTAKRSLFPRPMSTTEESSVASQYQSVLETVQSAGGSKVRLVAVSKTKPVAALEEAYAAGCRIFGENYAQELVDKVPAMPADVQWHFIGALQSNKANMLVKAVTPVSRLTIETVGSTKLANKLEKAVCDISQDDDSKLRVFVQVNTSGEDSKSGVSPGDECVDLCRHIVTECPHLELIGLMTIGAPGDATCFDTLVQTRADVLAADGMPKSLELSMGMSGDFEAAIAAGSTNVRVGSTIFGARDYSK